jgi:tellurite resistance protein
MTPAEKNVVKSLVAVAWADGRVEAPEAGVIEGLLCGFDATESEEREILEWSRTRRTLKDDVPLADLGSEERELLLANAALLTHADGEQSPGEKRVLDDLVELLGFTPEQAAEIIESAADGALQLGSKVLDPAD